MIKINWRGIIAIVCIAAVAAGLYYVFNAIGERRALLKIVERLSAETRVAQVIVTDGSLDGRSTTIKFLEYDSRLKPLPPKFFTFSGNTIQFQALVIRFDDFYIKKGHPLKGKSAYLFMKAFMLTNQGAQVFPINNVNEIPSGYAVEGVSDYFQRRLWRQFWGYALSPGQSHAAGIKSSQIEAPGTRFVPGLIYSIVIEHDGGLRIDAQEIPPILQNTRPLPEPPQ